MKVIDTEALNMSETLIVKKLKRNRQINVYSALVCLFFCVIECASISVAPNICPDPQAVLPTLPWPSLPGDLGWP